MKQSARKLCLFLMALCLLLGLLPVGAMATTEETNTGVEFLYQQLTLADDLIMNFEIAIEESIAQQAVVNLTVGKLTTSYTVSDMTPNESGNYVCSVEVAAAQMTKDITVSVIVENEVIASKVYTIKAYAEAILSGDYSKEVKTLVEKMLYYGWVAQAYFNYNTENPANANIGEVELLQVPAEIPEGVEENSATGAVTGITYKGNSMVFTGKLTLRYYFDAPNGVDGYTFTAKGNTYTPVQSTKEATNGWYYVDVQGINPHTMNDAVTLSVTKDTETLSVKYSPLHYIIRMYNSTSSASFQDLLQALYNYHLAAVGYVETIDNSLSVSEAIDQWEAGTFEPANIHGYVAGYGEDSKGVRKAIVLQDTETGECIEFWGSDTAIYNTVWSSYEVGDHVIIYTDEIKNNKGLPRAEMPVTPVMVSGSYKLSTDNEIQVTEITDMDAFLASILADPDANTLGVYTCTALMASNPTDYFQQIHIPNSDYKLKIQLSNSIVNDLEADHVYTMKFVLTGYNDVMDATGKNLYVRVSVMEATDLNCQISYTGETELYVGDEEPDFTKWFTITDGGKDIPVTADMITETVDMSTNGTCEVTLTYTNSAGKTVTKTVEIDVAYNVGVSGAIDLMGMEVPAYVNGYVAGYGVNANGNHTAVVLQDTETGEYIEFWANDHSESRETFNTYKVGDHVRLYTDMIVDNKGVPRIGSAKNGTRHVETLSTGNAITVKEISDMDTFLTQVNWDVDNQKGTNILGVYTYTGKVFAAEYIDEIILVDAEDEANMKRLRIQLHDSVVDPEFVVGRGYTMKFVVTGYGIGRDDPNNAYVRVSVMEATDVTEITPGEANYTMTVNGPTTLLKGAAEPDFTKYFTIEDSVDGKIKITSDMITETVDMSTEGKYQVELYYLNSELDLISETLEIQVIESSMSVSEAIALKGTNTPAYINGYVAGWSIEGDSRKAMILQDKTSGECIEFWAADSGKYNDVWNTYAVGDEVTVYTDAIVDHNGLPRASATVMPVELNGSYKQSTGNKIQVINVPSMDYFQTAYENGTNILGVYTYTTTVLNADYIDEIWMTEQTAEVDAKILRLQLYQSVYDPGLEVGAPYTIQFVVTAYSTGRNDADNTYIRLSIMEADDVKAVVPGEAIFEVTVNGATELLKGTAKPDFTEYFTIVDSVDGEIEITSDMITEDVDMSAVGTYTVTISCLNSNFDQISYTKEIKVIDSLSVSEAIKLKGTGTAAYINGYVAGYSVDGETRKAIVLQDTVTGECIEFWGSDSSAYNDIWSTYEVGDHVTIYASSIVDNKGLPRANKTVQPIQINGTYKLSTGNEIQVTEITDMDAFLNSVYSDGKNTLGVYTCTVTVADSNYFYEITPSGGKLRIQLYQSAVTPTMEVGSTYTIKFVLTGYNKALNNTGNLYVRVTVMDETDVVAAG